MYNITRGNTIPMKAILEHEGERFPVAVSTNISVRAYNEYRYIDAENVTVDQEEDGVLYFEIPPTLNTGIFGVEVKGNVNGVSWRTATDGVVKITGATQRNDGSEAVPEGDTYDIVMRVQLYKQQSSDRAIEEHNSDEASHPYILGELERIEGEIPTLPEHIVTDANYVHTDNNYTTEEKTKLANAITEEQDPTVPQWAKQQAKPSYNAQEVGALPNTTKYGSIIDLSMNSTTYVLTLSLKDQDGTVLNTKTVDLPIESVVVNGRYDAVNKKIVLTLQSGSTIDVPVGDLIAGLQTEITSVNMLDADLVDDTNSAHKFVTAQEKTTWNNKSDFSGSYNDLTDKPSVYTQQQTDEAIEQAKEDVSWEAKEYDVLGTGNSASGMVSNPKGRVVYYSSARVAFIRILSLPHITSTGISFKVIGTPIEDTDNFVRIVVAGSKIIFRTSNRPTIFKAGVTYEVEYTYISHTNLGCVYLESWVGGVSTAAYTGSYNDLSDKPTIPTVPTNVSAFNNDAGYLKQHQSLSDYIQKSQTAGLIKNDGTIDTNTYLTQHQDISGKADKSEMSVTDGTGADADKTTITLKNGTSATVIKQHQDISGKQDTLVSGTNIKTINNESILGSGNISIDISGKEDVTTIVAPVNATDATLPITTLATEVGKYYRIDVPVETLAVTLPVMDNITTTKTVVLYLTGGTTPAVTILSTAPTGGSAPDVYFSKGYAIESGKTYEVNCLWNGASWIVASVEIAVTNANS